MFISICLLILLIYLAAIPLLAITFGRWFILAYILVGGSLWGIIPDAVYQKRYGEKL